MNHLKIKSFTTLILIVIFSISMAVLTLLSIYNSNNEIDKKISFIHEKAKMKLHHQKAIILDNLNIFKRYSSILFNEIDALEIYDEKEISRIYRHHFLKEMGIFNIRLLNDKGVELIRYDLKQSKVIKSTSLQDKSNRYYYKEAQTLSFKDIYLSRFDLNIENKKIVIPYRNTIRMIKKIKISDKIYYVILNYDITKLFEHALSTTLYDIFLIEKDGQINMHLNDKYAFSKQKKESIFLKDLLFYEDQYILKKPLDGFPYHIVICIKKSKLASMKLGKQNDLKQSIIISILISLFITTVLLYLLRRILKRFNDKVLKIMEGEVYEIEQEFTEFEDILNDLKTQQKIINRSNKIISENVIYSITDLKGVITYASEAFCNMSGYREDELVGEPHNIIRHPDMPKSAFKGMWGTITRGKAWRGNVKNLKKDGGYYWVDAKIEPIFNNDGHIESYMAVRRDITDKIELDELTRNLEEIVSEKTYELENINITLEQRVKCEVQKNRQKDQQMIQQSRLAQIGEMISMIAHQWRQPLAAISSTSNSIYLKSQLDKLDKEKAMQLSQNISKYSQHLSTTIDDFREFFKPNKKKIETNYHKLIKPVLEMVETTIANQNISIIQELKCKDSFSTYTNELKQVILNLIKNAEDALLEKAVKDPYIKIATYSKEDEYILEVSDNAGGISEDIIEKIFDPYFSTKTKKDGTGLGLYMSNIIVEEHCNGTLSVSNSDDGAVFKIALTQIKGELS